MSSTVKGLTQESTMVVRKPLFNSRQGMDCFEHWGWEYAHLKLWTFSRGQACLFGGWEKRQRSASSVFAGNLDQGWVKVIWDVIRIFCHKQRSFFQVLTAIKLTGSTKQSHRHLATLVSHRGSPKRLLVFLHVLIDTEMIDRFHFKLYKDPESSMRVSLIPASFHGEFLLRCWDVKQNSYKSA